MASKKKLLQAAAGSAGGAGLDVDEVFSTYLYEGAGGTGVTVNNGIDLSGEGGLVWIKAREAAEDHVLFDTERGVTKFLESNTSTDEQTNSSTLTNFYSTGFRVDGNGTVGSSGDDYASWTFRKAPKFFDVVTYSGTGSTQNISHNLGAVPAVMMVKSLSSGSRWNVYHKDASPNGTPQNGRMALNTTDAYGEHPTVSVFQGLWNNTAPTDSVFTVGSYNDTNGSGQNFVAYLFAHNNNDGEFGPDSDQDIIKCGSYTGTGSVPGNFIDLGFEPQWVMVKSADQSRPWVMVNNMMGMPVDGSGPRLLANDSAGEVSNASFLAPRATGFEITKQNTYVNTSGETYIYIAIRRGPMAVPTDATDVFAMDTMANQTPAFDSGFPVDMAIRRNLDFATSNAIWSRLTGEKYMNTDSTAAESNDSESFDHMDGWGDGSTYSGNQAWMWRRAPSFFDVIAYTGGGYNTNVKHNLTVTPELCIAKSRTTNSVVDDWYVWSSHSGDGNDTLGFLNSTGTTAVGFHASSPSSTDLYLHGNVAYSGYPYIMYLFATVAGVSKVGSYTGNGASTQTIDCGFSSGARFVLLKRTDATDEWYVFDSVRGIVSGNDPFLMINNTSAEVSNQDLIEPHSSGFIINNWANGSGSSWIFYAIA